MEKIYALIKIISVKKIIAILAHFFLLVGGLMWGYMAVVCIFIDPYNRGDLDDFFIYSDYHYKLLSFLTLKYIILILISLSALYKIYIYTRWLIIKTGESKIINSNNV